MPFFFVAIFVFGALSCLGCGSAYTSDDTTANTIGAREESLQLRDCAQDDAGTCMPSRVRARSLLAYCANARELSAHGAPLPEGGPQCTPQ